ncbi:hypothetical protein BDM02DRAFT_3114082 [Thelephora ganbajun]|uniref:Uncharacterized protein n=1 Tax=Thelephora ganbajun TaxID=370292 RepID=A0ACB6ZHZ9_THEGA|nr:hypothetical protein BDM02DRAFT_3114082 [Thelephora ganbajun]
MNPNQDQISQPSGPTRSTQPAFLTTATGHPDHLHAPARRIHSINPLRTLKDPSKAFTRPHLYSGHSFPISPPLSPHLSTPASTSSHTTVTPSPIISVRTSSTRHSSLQSPSAHPSPAQSSSIPLPRDNTRSVLSKRTRNYTPSPPTLYSASQIPPPHVSLPSPHLLPAEPSVERPAKRPRLDMGHSSGEINRGGSQPPASSRPPHPSQPRPKKAPRHPLAVDYSRPMKPVVPQPPFCRLSLRKNGIPLPPCPENSDPKRSLDDELRGFVDPAIAGELGGLMWMQQKRVWDEIGGYADHWLHLPIPISLLDTRSSNLGSGATPGQPQPETAALYGPTPRNNGSVHLGESLTNPNVIVLDDDEDDGFGEVLDLYRGAVQGSTLSAELELAVGGDDGLTGVGWEDASSLEVSIRRRSPLVTSAGELRESQVCTLAEYKQVMEAEKTLSSLKPVMPKEQPPLGIEWSYSCSGYSAGRVIDFLSVDSVPSPDVNACNRKRR